MDTFIDFSSGSMNKYKEELCGDKVEFYKDEDKFIAVLSDGLGSGVKANILATLTSKIAITMLKSGADIYEVVDTIANTLPVCSIRKLAYSTFTIVSIDKTNMVYIAEFDNPSMFFLRNGVIADIKWDIIKINERTVKESRFKLKEKDILIFVSDGVIHAGVGMVLNLGWKWCDVAKYIEKYIKPNMLSKNITDTLLGVCDQLYMQQPGDDTTVACVKVTKSKKTILFSGPPIDKSKDSEIVEKLMKYKGNKIICGGTAANIVARELNEQIRTSFEILDKNVPPISYIKGINLVTEGVLTLKQAIEKLENIKTEMNLKFLDGEDGACKLAKLLFVNSTHIKFLVGGAINPAHQNQCFPKDMSVKIEILEELQRTLISLGKIIEIEYF